MVRSFLITLLILVLFPFYSVLFISIHELGHVAVMRLYGDDEAWFYIVKVDENGRCLGCTTNGEVDMPWSGEVLRSLGGLIMTQTIALTALLLLSLRPRRRWIVTTLSVIALTFAIFDILAQVPQGLYYNLERMSLDTGVDLAKVMMLIQMKIDVSQYVLKGILLAGTVLYLIGFIWFYRRNRRAIKRMEPSPLSLQEGLQPPASPA